MPLPITDKVVDQAYVAIGLTALILAQQKFGVLTWARNKMGGITIFKNKKLTMSGYHVLSYFLVMTGWAVVLGIIPTDSGSMNVMLWRAFQAHWVIILAIFLVLFTSGFSDIIRGVSNAAVLMGWHELVWNIAAIFGLGFGYFAYFWSFDVFLVVVIAFYYFGGNGKETAETGQASSILARLKSAAGGRAMTLREEVLVVGVMVVFHAVWVAAGFPVSVNDYTEAVNLTSIPIALTENLSWMIPASIMVMFELFKLMHLLMKARSTGTESYPSRSTSTGNGSES